MELILGVVVGLLILTILVVIHELGHALVARRYDVRVEEFGVGFPPRAKAWKRATSFLGKNVVFSLNWLPIGGFVKLQGESDTATKAHDYGRATLWQKTQILFAGVVMNWLTAVLILTILSLFGLPRLLPNQFHVASDTIIKGGDTVIVNVVDGSPAAKAGLRPDDAILSLDGTAVSGSAGLSEFTKQHAGQTVAVEYARGERVATTDVTLNTAEQAKNSGYLGVAASNQERLRSTWSAPIVGVGFTAQLSWETLKGLGSMVSNFSSGIAERISSDEATQAAGKAKLSEASQSVTGPVGLVGSIVPQMLSAGIEGILLLTAIIAVSLAVLNSLPIPALDGGRFFLTFVFRVLLRRPLTAETEAKINGYGMLFLLSFIVLVTVIDVRRLLG